MFPECVRRPFALHNLLKFRPPSVLKLTTMSIVDELPPLVISSIKRALLHGDMVV
jgi:hypothetical protein